MKKYFSLLIFLLMANVTFATWNNNCTNQGGIIINANKYGNDKGGLCNDPNEANLANNCNGKSFCMSKEPMNWWSAFNWCQSIGGKLATFDSMCPNTQRIINTNLGACPNLYRAYNVAYWGWTDIGYQDDKAFMVAMWDKWAINVTDRNCNYSFCAFHKVSAFCEE